jgi:subtilase family serine protease
VPSEDVTGSVTFTVADVSKIDGGSPAGASTARYYLWVNNVVDASDVVLGSRQVPALGAGAASSGSTVFILPAGTAPGRYYVIAQADGEQEVGEVFENNNTFALLVTVG